MRVTLGDEEILLGLQSPDGPYVVLFLAPDEITRLFNEMEEAARG